MLKRAHKVHHEEVAVQRLTLHAAAMESLRAPAPSRVAAVAA